MHHDRMPAILAREDEETWLNPDITEPEQLQPLLKPYPADEMQMYEVPRAARFGTTG
jgi:putative SOS response-associated peptidase YedK